MQNGGMEPLTFGPFDSRIEYRLRPGGYVVVTDERGRVAVLRGRSGVFLPGGGQQPDESPEQAALREAFEETGLRVVLEDRIGVADELVFAGGDWGHFRKRCTFFVARIAEDAERVVVPPSEGVLEWTESPLALDVLRHGSQRWALSRAISPRAADPALADEPRSMVWRQLGAAIDSLDDVLDICPDSVWAASAEEPWFWYMAFHVTFFLDYDLAERADAFSPPAPFTLAELDPAGVLPDRVYAKSEVRAYLAYCREKVRARSIGSSTTWLQSHHVYCNFEGSGFEMLLYSMRHVQHHTAQLVALLRRHGIAAPRWVKRARGDADR
jgi:8-oxo-dGTP pyrophosphatase MutT (NUDIX family)